VPHWHTHYVSRSINAILLPSREWLWNNGCQSVDVRNHMFGSASGAPGATALNTTNSFLQDSSTHLRHHNWPGYSKTFSKLVLQCWHCWLGRVTRKIVSEMTYNVSSGTLNSTIPIPISKTTWVSGTVAVCHSVGSRFMPLNLPDGSTLKWAWGEVWCAWWVVTLVIAVILKWYYHIRQKISNEASVAQLRFTILSDLFSFDLINEIKIYL